ncbi:MAG: TonB-dependent receptor [Gammaproteobacteria bacterium]|nr:TonB-dependent receptor [Gammaproteobacteria bacterium]
MFNHPRHTRSRLALAIATAAVSVICTAADAENRKADTSFSVGEIIVTAKGMAGSTDYVLTSVDRLGGDVAQQADIDNVYELVGQMPGVQVTDFNQGTTNGKFSFRAFNGEGEINAVKLLLDGIPSNSNTGNMPYIDMIFPLNIETIEVVRGTSDARYGLHNIAGSANIITRTGDTYLDARLAAGSYDTFEAQLTGGYATGTFTQNYQFAYRESDGYRDHGGSDRFSLSGKWTYAMTENATIGAIARYYEADAEEPGYLTYADSRAAPRMTNAYNVSDGDARDMMQYAVTLDVGFSDNLDWSSLAYYNRLRDDRYVKFSAGASQQRRLTREDVWGVSSIVHFHGDLGAIPFMLEFGGNVEWQDNESLRWLAVERVPTSQTRDQQYDLNVGGVYIEAVFEPTDWLRITPAWRIDWVGGDFRNRLADTTAPINDYGSIDQPKLSVALTPTDDITLYANWGKTYQIGLGSGAYLIPPRQIDLEPSINEGWETGIKYAPGDRLELRVAWWEQTATGELKRKLNDPLGDFENVGATDRKGVDVQVNLALSDTLDIWGAVAWQKATINTPDPATPQYAGNTIDHTPRWLWSAGVSWQPMDKLVVELTGRAQSSYYLSNANAEGRFGDYAVLDAQLRYRLSDRYELGLSVKNITSTYYEYVWYDGAQSLHSPANGRNAMASVRARY